MCCLPFVVSCLCFWAPSELVTGVILRCMLLVIRVSLSVFELVVYGYLVAERCGEPKYGLGVPERS
jgi:hypothetical protein